MGSSDAAVCGTVFLVVVLPGSGDTVCCDLDVCPRGQDRRRLVQACERGGLLPNLYELQTQDFP